MRSALRTVAPALVAPRYEVIPTASIADKVVTEVPRTVTVTVTASPTKGLEPSWDLTEQLRAQGFRVVPHLSARLVIDFKHLTDICERLVALGVNDVFVPAGDSDPPRGRYDSSLKLLHDLDRLGRPFRDVGITGYPESHPTIPDDVTVQAMWDKRHYATYVVSNLCFSAPTIRAWAQRLRARGVTLPLYFGLAGPVEQTKLLRMATKIGVGESTRTLMKHRSWLLHMGAPGGYDPSRLLRGVASTVGDPHAGVAGVHVFTFNQLRETELWRQALLRQFLSPDATPVAPPPPSATAAGSTSQRPEVAAPPRDLD